MQEMIESLGKCKNNKARGIDNIRTRNFQERLIKFYNKCWKQNTIPEEWKNQSNNINI